MKAKPYCNDAMYYIHCPGCYQYHYIRVKPGPDPGPVWDFNNDTEKPTFGPSIKIIWGDSDGNKCCHFFIREGRIEYCDDCTHQYNGQTLELQDLKEETP